VLATGIAMTVLDALAQSLPPAPQKSPPVAAAQSHRAKVHGKKQTPVAEVPATPPPPPTLEEQPPAPPQITYQNGQLSITSRNATLSQVLRYVQSQTGASVDMPPGAGTERVVASLGPGKPREILASLLNGSKFNYVILGEKDNPGAVQKIILLAKSSSPASGGSITTAQNTVPPPSQVVESPEDEYPQNEPEVEMQNQLVPAQPGGEQLTPGVINPVGRTPEQMLQELQRIQQQQQQMQEQLNPANQQPQQPMPSQPMVMQPQPQ